MEIAAASYQVYIGYITDPQLICLCRNESLDQVPVHVIAVVGVGRMPRFRPLLEHVEVSQDAKESIPSGNPVFGKHPLQHQPQLIVADARIHPPDLGHCIDDLYLQIDSIKQIQTTINQRISKLNSNNIFVNGFTDISLAYGKYYLKENGGVSLGSFFAWGI